MTLTSQKVDTTKLNKRYYTIAEVSTMFDVAKSLLRYWEGEFKQIQPRKDRGGTRRYTVKDVEHINKIFDLLKNRGFTIDGARKELAEISATPHKTRGLKKRLQSILDRLKSLRSDLE